MGHFSYVQHYCNTQRRLHYPECMRHEHFSTPWIYSTQADNWRRLLFHHFQTSSYIFNISDMCICFIKARSHSGQWRPFHLDFLCAKLRKEKRLQKNPRNLCGSLQHLSIHMCVYTCRIMWCETNSRYKHSTDQRSDITPHLPEDVIGKKPNWSQTRRWTFVVHQRSMQNNWNATINNKPTNK